MAWVRAVGGPASGPDRLGLAAAPDPERPGARVSGRRVAHVGVAVHRATADFEVRAFFPGNTGLTEDPVTGSLNAALAQWLIEAGHAPAASATSSSRPVSPRAAGFPRRKRCSDTRASAR